MYIHTKAKWAQFQKLTYKRFQKILQTFQTLENAWEEQSRNVWMKNGFRASFVESFFAFRSSYNESKALETLEKNSIQIVSIDEDGYPRLLKEICDPPVFLYYQGTLEKERETLLGVVGSRKYTEYGKRVCQEFVSDMVKRNITIVSGLALGIDGLAHSDTLQNGGRTVAVLGGGLLHIHPVSHRSLAQKIIETGGMICSEVPPDIKAQAFHFPRRNRIISGMSRGVFVVEAAKKSGSLITARLALEQNREVFAVCGSIFQKSVEGTNVLIQKGEAKLVQKAEDIFEEIQSQGQCAKVEYVPKNEREKSLYEYLLNNTCHISELSHGMDINISEINMHLSMLELEGVVRNCGNGYWEGI